MKFDKYYMYARILPAVICSVPLTSFTHFYINRNFSSFLHKLQNIQFAAEITMPFAFILFFVFVSRSISKMLIEKRRYGGETNMPSTNILLYGNDIYSTTYKKRIHEKIRNDFNIKLLSRKEEVYDEVEARKRIVEAVSHIKEQVKGGRLLLQHNMEYGFFRNLVGGSFISALFSIYCTIFFYLVYPDQLAYVLSLVNTVIYTSIVLFHPQVMDWLGYLYAKRLIQEYMTVN